MNLVQIKQETIDWYIKRINSGVPLSLSRWGDGEWRSTLTDGKTNWIRLEKINRSWKHGRTNKSGHGFSDEMGAEMRALLRSRPKQILTMAGRFGNANAKKPMIDLALWIKEWLDANKLSDIPWGSCDTIVYALINQEFEGFLDCLQDKRILLVGPKHLQRLKVIPYIDHVVVPDRNAYNYKNWLYKKIANHARHTEKPMIVSISMGPAAPILIEELHRDFGKHHSFIDLGSIWDGFAGVQSRRYLEKPETKNYINRLRKKYVGE